MLCGCPSQGDLNDDGTINAVDLIHQIGIVLKFTKTVIHDPNCPHSNRADLDCSGSFSIIDIVIMVDKIWRGMDAICDPCKAH